MTEKKGGLFVISGPSGAGKGTVIKRVLDRRDDLRFSISATTRPARKDEVDGVHYYFVTRERFLEMIERGELLEYFTYLGNLYGTPSKPISQHIESGGLMLLDVETNGARRVKELIPESATVYLTPSTFSELERRLRNRGTETEEEIHRRMVQAKIDSITAEEFDYIIINDDIDAAERELLDIINGDGDYCRPGQRLKMIEIGME